jgi:hypothetical protein
MRTVTAATGRQGKIIVRIESEEQRSCREKQDEEDGKGTPHPCVYAIRNFGDRCDSGIEVWFRYHRCIPNLPYPD